MKTECVKDKLYKAVLKAEKIVGKNNNMPVLSCLLFETKGNNLIIRSTNLDLGFEISIPARVEKQGKISVPAGIINSFLGNLSDDKNILLESKEGVLVVKTQTSEASIKTLPTEDFPTLPKVEEGKISKINSKDIQNGIKSVIYSASLSGVKPELSSIYMYSSEEGLVFVATDSFRLAEKSVKTRKSTDFSGVLLPFKNASDILKIIDDFEEDIEVNTTKNQISMSFNGIYLVSRVIDGVFPDYKQIIPKEEKTKAVVLKQDLINALKISNIFSDSFNQMNISVESGAKNIKVKTKNANVGENTNTMDAHIEGETINANFNYKYIIDCLPSILSDSISLSFNGVNKPLIIKGTSDKTFTYLVMPMNR